MALQTDLENEYKGRILQGSETERVTKDECS